MELFTKKICWVLAATWALIIFNLSRAPFSSASSARFISRVLDWLSIPIVSQNINLLNTLLRKSSHVTEYAVLAVLLYNSLKPVGGPLWSQKSAFWALLASGIYSLTDEFHQLFVPGRTASLLDCPFDTTGAVLGLVVLSSAIVLLRRKQAGVVAQAAKAIP